MDAVTGDQWNVELREAAKECLDVVYSDAGEGHGGGDSGPNYGGGGGGGMMSSGAPGGMAGLQQQKSYGGPVAATGIGGGGYGAPMGGASGSGYGGDNNSYGGAGGGAGGSRMQGIGNPMFTDPRLEQQQQASTTVGKAMAMATEVGGAMLGMIKDPLAKQAAAMQQQNQQPPHPNMGTYGGPNMRPDPYSQPPGRNNLAMQTGGQWTMASNRGPNAIGGQGGGVGGMAPPVATEPSQHDDSEYYKARNATGQAFNWASSGGGGAPAAPSTAAPPSPARTVNGVGGSWATAPVAPPPPPPPQQQQPPSASSTPQLSVAAQSRMDANQSGPYSGGGGGGGGFVAPTTTATAGDYEKNLIAELCPPGGMKAEPPQDKLQEFARSVPSLNPDLVCPALLDALEDGNPWIMRAKALCVIETVLKVMDQQQGESNAYADFFHACASEIEPLANHARQSVKAPAKRVLGLLGVAPGVSSPVRSNGAAAAAAPPVAEAPNLLDFDGPTTADVPAPVAATVAPPAPPTVTSTANVSSGESMFGGMTMKSTAPSTSSPATPALVSTESTESSGDLLGTFSVSAEAAPVAAAPAPSSGSLFGNMTVKSTAAPATTAPAEPAAAAAAPTDASSVGPSSGGSAFGFLNNATTATPSTPSRPAPKPVAMAPASPAASYDPLLSLGAPTATSSNSNGAMNNMNGMNTANPMAQMNPAQMNPAQMQQMQMAYQQNMMMMQQQMQQMQMGAGGAGAGGQGYVRQGSKPNVMGANYMRQVPGVQGDNSSFSFLGAPKKKETHEFDFVKDAMKRG